MSIFIKNFFALCLLTAVAPIDCNSGRILVHFYTSFIGARSGTHNASKTEVEPLQIHSANNSMNCKNSLRKSKVS